MRPIKLTALILTLLMTFGLTSCGSQSKNNAEMNDSGVTTEDQDMGNNGMNLELNGDSDSGKAGTLSTVYFDFNSSSLSSSTRDALESNANFLKENPSVEVQIEGHADERGGVQYNLALGERRAQAVKQYLVSMGVSSSRITTISFGKERPIAFGHTESAWSQNRRANFVITAK
ncbi:MAG: peptidoglycan-associated lipoprotein [Halobacteriovoraceae bacterium]|nr:peptidoglycan-associated lipoprotein [Halobacteriovoraceae bacterium]|tara:strand:- start:5997 stop:6518 length:522 start_codon:yes stop_codon:yes gene_type:complete